MVLRRNSRGINAQLPIDTVPPEIITFAEKHLEPFNIHGTKLTPRYCPICGGGDNRDPNTFSIYPDERGRWVYRCLRASCQNSKGVFDNLYREVTGESRKFSTENFVSRMSPKLYALPDASSLSPPTEDIYGYFESRKISRATVDAFKIQTDKNGNIAFPFYENDAIVYMKYRRPQKYEKSMGMKEWCDKNTKPILFGLNMTSYSQPLIITEGQIDCMALYEAGIRNVVSVPAGANNESWIDNCWDELQNYESIILFGDGDTPGRTAVESWAHRLDEARCSIVNNYPPRPNAENKICKDANEILFFYGAEKLHEMIASAEEVEMEGLVDISAVPSHNPTHAKMIPSSLYTINYELGGYAPGDLVCWTGRTGDGKSTLVSQEILQAIESGERVVWYTAELSPIKLKRSLLLQAAGSSYVGLDFDPRRDREIPVVSDEVASRINDWLKGRIMLCTDNVSTMNFDSDYLVELLKYARRRNGCTVAVVDNIMTAVMGADDDSYFRAQEKFTLELKRVATSLGMVVHLVAHPRKTRENLTNDDVAGSASITRLADTVISVKHGEVKVLKDRNEGNVNANAKFIYYPDCKLCEDLASSGQPMFSWDREGVPFPSRRANTVYQPIQPSMLDYPI